MFLYLFIHYKCILFIKYDDNDDYYYYFKLSTNLFYYISRHQTLIFLIHLFNILFIFSDYVQYYILF